ncbi:helix-turn-helix domain-containing protein [Novosphingobium sp. RD2P27]|uniref:Helix-turn-helix domain-containing protein n=1 Tax=Novosphingobium kalidii TaxID=3230299 RepID=A0ABV2D2P5_9SPHN
MLHENTKQPGPSAVVRRPGERRSLSRSATRALDVLELFGVKGCPLRAVEIGGILDLTPSSTNQILKTMVDSGHLVFDARRKTYLPSPRLTRFSRWIIELYGSNAHLHDLLTDIQQRTGLVATASSPNDLFMQIVDAAIPEGAAAERGLRISIFGSAIGAAYLSTLDDADLARLADRARLAKDQTSALPRQVAAVRADGFAQGPSLDGRLWSVAMAMPNRGFHLPTVIGVAGDCAAVQRDIPGLVEIMQRAIAERFSPSVESGEEG